ncbi:hypothetical protein MVEN_00247700 [Mycena venus]|uniref:Uncharacterized protein n=1 Tax=Mycena venus TaxID=2733690 RepID=A0A8H6Z201_9AGAR|nr:hypothetical protein MVEN_00247700 [Mycena venus]
MSSAGLSPTGSAFLGRTRNACAAYDRNSASSSSASVSAWSVLLHNDDPDHLSVPTPRTTRCRRPPTDAMGSRNRVSLRTCVCSHYGPKALLPLLPARAMVPPTSLTFVPIIPLRSLLLPSPHLPSLAYSSSLFYSLPATPIDTTPFFFSNLPS